MSSPTATETDLYAEANAVLTDLVGSPQAQLRTDQWQAVHALVVQRARSLVVQRTGWGKSAVYFVATALLRARGGGPTLIISPLLALMRDQVAAAQRANIRAITLNSANTGDWHQLHAQINADAADVVLCSPERLNNPTFREEVLPQLAATAGLVVVDEAHCISDWGHDFRPDYRRIATLLQELPARVPVLATTATANERVCADVGEQLGAEVLTLRGGLDRQSLHLTVAPVADQPTRLAWLEHQLAAYHGSGIIYCLTVAAAEETSRYLRRAGYEVAAYTGGTDPAQREELERSLLANDVKALVATSALGMGFDKSDLAFVIHLGAPPSPIGYYQQIGRAGRATDRADVVLLPGPEDQSIWDYFGSLSFPAQEAVTAALEVLPGADEKPMSIAVLETHVDLRRTRLELMLKVLDVEGAVRRVRGGWVATGKPWTYDAQRYDRVAQARVDEQAAMVRYEATDECRMLFLRRCLDDPTLTQEPCGRCENCGGTPAPQLPAAGDVADAAEALNRPGVEIQPRKQWPTGMKNAGVQVAGRALSGKIPAPAQVGRALARLDGLGLSLTVREAVTASDGEVPAGLRAPLAQLLTDWDPQVDAVVAVDSHTRPQLVRHLATGVSGLLQVPIQGAVTIDDEHREPTSRDVNSAHRLTAAARRLRLGDLEVSGRRVLLVDDVTYSGWTLTVAAQLLMHAGAHEVAPLTLGLG